MNTLIPIAHELPANTGQPFRPIEPERMHLRQLFGILLQRAKLGLGVAGVVFVLVLAAFAMKTPTYSAMGSVVVDPKHENMAEAERRENGFMPPDTSAVDTQVEILRSPALASGFYEEGELRPLPLADGFLPTGDLGSLQDGKLRISGRKPGA